MPGERVIDINRGIVLRLADIHGEVDLVLLERPRRRTSRPKNAGSRGVGLSGNAEGSSWVVVIPGVPSDENVRRIGGHGHDQGTVCPRDRSSSEVREL